MAKNVWHCYNIICPLKNKLKLFFKNYGEGNGGGGKEPGRKGGGGRRRKTKPDAIFKLWRGAGGQNLGEKWWEIREGGMQDS